MAEKSDDDLDDGFSDDLEEKIRKLEKEKKKLQKQNLQKKYKELSKSVTSLRSNAGPSDYEDVAFLRSPGTSPMRDKNLSHREKETSSVDSGIAGILNESRAKLKALQRRSGESGSTRHTAVELVSEEDSEEEPDRGNLDRVMSKEHKQKLQINRDTLVENMIPDDIFNDLIANKVLTTADVSRIKEKNTRESMNEELLNNLVRRSDRAFYEFVRSLRKTLQGYLADMLDEPQHHQTKKRTKRKRQAGEMNISVDCEDISPVPKKPSCTCAEVEHEILIMAKTAYKAIRRRDNTPASFEQFKKELSQTNEIVKESMEIMHTLKILCKHGDIDIYHGSVIFTVRCNSVKCVEDLWRLHVSGKLQKLLQEKFVTRTLLTKCKASAIRLRVRILELEYKKCLLELRRKERMAARLKKNRTKCADRLLRSSVVQEDSSENYSPKEKPYIATKNNNRRAFREISRNTSFTELRPAMNVPSLTIDHGMGSHNLYNKRLRSHSYQTSSNAIPTS